MSQPRRATFALPRMILAAAALVCAIPALAASARPSPAIDVASDLRSLAQQRPWTCAGQDAGAVPGPGWRGGRTECAWQDRLRMRSWSGQGGAPHGACVSAQARWWAWSRNAAPVAANASLAWHTAWAGNSIVDDSGAEKRVLILQRLVSGEWSVTEWRWNPSPRAATRRWQEGRWKLLLARAQQLRAASQAPQGAAHERMLRKVLSASLANHVSEIGDQTWQWEAGGLCLGVDAAGLGQQIMQLPYAADDSRMEQRAAMQLQLARRYPKATWLTDFSLVPAAVRARGGAKFYAVWIDQNVLKGQLWIPTKADGPLVRVRITTALPGTPGQADPQALRHAEQVLTRELTALAARWVAEHE